MQGIGAHNLIHHNHHIICYVQISTMNACTSITYHLSFSILNSQKHIRHTCDFLIDELLSYMSPTLIYQLF